MACAQAGSAKTSSPAPATSVTTANAPPSRPRPAPPLRAAPRAPAPPRAPALSGSFTASGASSRPRSTSEYSTASDGTRTTAPAATPTMVAISVSRPAAASCTVSPGSTCGSWAAAHPAMTAATARAADARAKPNRPSHTSTMVSTPASALTTTKASPSPELSPCHKEAVAARITSSPASASRPATTPAASARRRKSCTSACSDWRRASAARYTAARYAEKTTASTPASTDTGFSHEVTTLPRALPTGTRPVAIAPITVASANGVSTEDSANSRSTSRTPRSSPEPNWLRSAYAVPRKMIPIAAISSGTASVDTIEPNAPGKHVQATVSTKMSQTWLASHTGPIACLVWSRVAAVPACPPPGTSVQMPAPKSAPDSTVYAVMPSRMNTIGTSASMVIHLQALRQALRALKLKRHPAEPAQQPPHRPAQAQVDDPQRAVAERDDVRPGHGRVDPHHLVDDPRLAAHLGGDPAGDQRHHGQRPGRHHRPAEPPRRQQLTAPPPEEQVDQAEQGQQGADADHGLEGEPDHVHRRLVGQRDDVQALHGGVRVVEGEQRQQPRDLDPVHHRVPVVPAEQVLGRAARGDSEALHRGQLDRLGLAHVPGGPVAHHDLKRGRDGGRGQRDAEPGPLVPPPPSAQEGPGVGARHQEARHDVGREVHMHVLGPEERVREKRRPRMRVHRLPVAQREPGRVVHPRVDRDDEERARDARHRDRDPGPEVQPRLEPVRAVGVDPDEAGSGAARCRLQREADRDRVADILDLTRPQQAELEGQDRAGDHAHREQREHDLGPAPGQGPVERVTGAQVTPLGEQDHDREGDAEAHQRDVHG